jgi:NAD(P)-dependent dehydrogenase (short-subunit alcohol dehydrogenase family)
MRACFTHGKVNRQEHLVTTPCCIVVGAGPGIGLAVARRFAREGFHAALIARRPAVLETYVAGFRQAGLSASAHAADAADIDESGSIVSAFEQIAAAHGSPDVLVYNVAAVVEGQPSTLEVETLLRHFRVNVAAALLSAQQVIPAMLERGSGTILLTGGGLALNPNPAYASLAIGKAGLRSLAYSLGAELEPHGIRVATVTVAGSVRPGTYFDPDRIADVYWALHTQTGPDRQREVIYRQPAERESSA